MPAHGYRRLRAKDTYHLMYNLFLWQRESMERTTDWSWARQGRDEMGGTGMAGAERKRRSNKRECQEGGELKGCHRLKTFTLMGHDRFNFQSTTIKVMNGRRLSRTWRTQAHRGCKRVCVSFAVIYEVVSAGAKH